MDTPVVSSTRPMTDLVLSHDEAMHLYAVLMAANKTRAARWLLGRLGIVPADTALTEDP